MNERIKELAKQAQKVAYYTDGGYTPIMTLDQEKFAELIIQSCIDKIETYRIPVGNSAAGELACEWTYAALKEIRDDIKETFGLPDA
jgi:hypothetical protein